MRIEKNICSTRNMLRENGYTIEEESKMYDEDLEAIYHDPRWFLDNLNILTEYRVRWKYYANNIPTLPYIYVYKEKGL